MSDKYINSFIIKNAGNQEQEVRIKIPLEQVEGARDLKDEAEATARKLASLKEELEYQEDMLTAQGIILKETIPGTYSIREVAGGLDIYDNSLAEVKKVKGNTIAIENLIPAYKSSEITEHGLKFTSNLDGSITVARVNGDGQLGSVHLTDTFSLPAGTYYFNGKAPNVNSYYCYIHCEDSSFNNNIVTSQGTFTLSRTFVVSLAFYSPGSNQVESCTFYPKLVRGNEEKPFIKSFDGLKSTTFSGIRSTGKNFCKPVSYRVRRGKEEFGPRINGNRPWDGCSLAFRMTPNNVYDYFSYDSAETEKNNSGWLAINNDEVTFKAPQYTGFSIDVPCVEGKTYCFSVNKSSTDKVQVTLSFFKEDGSFISFSGGGGFPHRAEMAPSGAKWLCCTIRCLPEAAHTPITVGKFQLEEGVTTPTPYEPYKESVLKFSKTELGWGDEIDFEKQQIIRKSYFTLFKGVDSERWQSYAAGASFGKLGAITMNFNDWKNTAPIGERRVTNIITSLPFPVKFVSDWYAADQYYNTDGGQFPAILAYRVSAASPVTGFVFYQIMEFLGFTDIEDFKTYLSTNPVAVCLVTEESLTTTSFATDNEYRVFEGGTEQVIGNDAAQWGTDLTLTQEYIVKPRGGSDGN